MQGTEQAIVVSECANDGRTPQLSVADGDAIATAVEDRRVALLAPVGSVHRAPGASPSGKQGGVLTVDFTVFGIASLGLIGRTAFQPTDAFS